MLPLGLAVTVPVAVAVVLLFWWWIVIVPIVGVVLLVAGPPAYGWVRAWRQGSRPAFWFATGYAVGAVILVLRLPDVVAVVDRLF